MTSQSDKALTVFIGRFQPFHNGHLEVVKTALSKSEHVLLLCGSNNCPRTLANPFFFDERVQMIGAAFTEDDKKKLLFCPLDDYPYDDAYWIKHTKDVVHQMMEKYAIHGEIALIGYKKDQSSYYLDLFPDWQWWGVDNFEEISATPIRKDYLRYEQLSQAYQRMLPKTTIDWLERFKTSKDYDYLHAEQTKIDEEQKEWAVAPYPPIFVTVDALVKKENSILVVKRKNHPGKDLLALPGGFLNPKETLINGCLRELEEETLLNLPKEVWQSHFKKTVCYSAVDRSERGRVITHVFYFDFSDDEQFSFAVQGNDDAEQAFWMPIQQLEANLFFDDHYHIIRDILGFR